MLLAQAGQTIVRTLDTNLVVRLPIGYDLDRQSRYELLERLVRTRGVVVDDIDAVLDALEQFRQGGDRGRWAHSCPCRTHRCLAGVELRSALLQL